MKQFKALLIFCFAILAGCQLTGISEGVIELSEDSASHPFTEKEILVALDDTPTVHPFVSLPRFGNSEHPMTGNRISLYADSLRWAIVFETTSYSYTDWRLELQLNYFGNCLLNLDSVGYHHNLACNSKWNTLISANEILRLLSMKSTGDIKYMVIRDDTCYVNQEFISYKDTVSASDSLTRLLSHLRVFDQKNKVLLRATESELRTCIPSDLPKLMIIENWHHENYVTLLPNRKFGTLPSSYETFKLIAKVLVTKDTSLYKPTEKPNNHWKNW